VTVRRATAALLTSAALLLLSACGTDGGTEPTSAGATSESTASDVPSSDVPTTEEPTHEPTDNGPTFPEGTAPQTTENSGEWDLVLADVSVGEHDGYDRIVLEFTGTGTPGWTVNYVDEAVLDGSGEVVELDGDAILDIYASGTTYPESEQDPYDGPRQFQPASGGDVVDVYVAGTFEGYTQVLAGIQGDRVPFRVFALSDPSRLVVDVADNS
jgi:hypothetical protein